jgi:uncharacterized membrane protein YeaQ/YmgE (transglycosylase-associated protein family)
MGIFGWIFMGLIAGSIAQTITRRPKQGCITTFIIGVIGAVVGGAIMNAAGHEGITHFGWHSMLVAFIGAAGFCLILNALSHPRTFRR